MSKMKLFKQAEQMYLKGLTVSEISQELGIAKRTLFYWKKQYDWDKKRKESVYDKSQFKEDLQKFAQKLIEKLDSTSNMEPVVNTFQNYADSISKLISNINFTEYSPFLNNSEEAKTVNYIDGLLCHTTLTFIILEISKIKVQQLSLSKQDICERLNHLSEMDLQKIEKQKNQIHDAIDILYKNTKAIQADFLGKMDYLHKKTNNKTRWFEGTRGIVESTEKNIDNYVKSSINIKK